MKTKEEVKIRIFCEIKEGSEKETTKEDFFSKEDIKIIRNARNNLKNKKELNLFLRNKSITMII